MVIEITSLEQFREITAQSKPAVFDFWAEWCGPCRMISPIFEKLSESVDISGGLSFYKVNVDEAPEISEEVGIRSLPTFMLFKDGNKVEEFHGANPSALEQLIAVGSTL